jgi:serine protease Do
MTNLVDELSETGQRIATTVQASVVGVGRRGTGVIVADGVVATNAHNVRHDQVEVRFADGRDATATVTAADLDGDLAVLAVDTGDAPPITWADHEPEPGTAVFALANPGGRGPRISFGVVSSVGRSFRGPRGRRIAGSLEHTAPLARGSSGGPVVDSDGRAIGLNTHRLGDGFYLALPLDENLRSRLTDLQAGQTPSRRTLGVAVVPPRVARRLRAAVGLPERDGLLVRAVDPEAPAAQAGVRDGDLIVEAGGRALASVDDLHDVLDQWTEPSLELRVVRGTDELTVTVAFG